MHVVRLRRNFGTPLGGQSAVWRSPNPPAKRADAAEHAGGDTPLVSAYVYAMAKLTPEQQKAYDDMRAQPGILFDDDGNVIFDGEAEAMGPPPFKTRAEFDAQQAKLQAQLATRRKEREEVETECSPHARG